MNSFLSTTISHFLAEREICCKLLKCSNQSTLSTHPIRQKDSNNLNRAQKQKKTFCHGFKASNELFFCELLMIMNKNIAVITSKVVQYTVLDICDNTHENHSKNQIQPHFYFHI